MRMKEGHGVRCRGPGLAVLPRSHPGAPALANMEAGTEGVRGAGHLAGLGDPKGLLERPRINLTEQKPGWIWIEGSPPPLLPPSPPHQPCLSTPPSPSSHGTHRSCPLAAESCLPATGSNGEPPRPASCGQVRLWHLREEGSPSGGWAGKWGVYLLLFPSSQVGSGPQGARGL